eukprot:gene7440-8705_t
MNILTILTVVTLTLLQQTHAQLYGKGVVFKQYENDNCTGEIIASAFILNARIESSFVILYSMFFICDEKGCDLGDYQDKNFTKFNPALRLDYDKCNDSRMVSYEIFDYKEKNYCIMTQRESSEVKDYGADTVGKVSVVNIYKKDYCSRILRANSIYWDCTALTLSLGSCPDNECSDLCKARMEARGGRISTSTLDKKYTLEYLQRQWTVDTSNQTYHDVNDNCTGEIIASAFIPNARIESSFVIRDSMFFICDEKGCDVGDYQDKNFSKFNPLIRLDYDICNGSMMVSYEIFDYKEKNYCIMAQRESPEVKDYGADTVGKESDNCTGDIIASAFILNARIEISYVMLYNMYFVCDQQRCDLGYYQDNNYTKFIIDYRMDYDVCNGNMMVSYEIFDYKEKNYCIMTQREDKDYGVDTHNKVSVVNIYKRDYCSRILKASSIYWDCSTLTLSLGSCLDNECSELCNARMKADIGDISSLTMGSKRYILVPIEPNLPRCFGATISNNLDNINMELFME